jgi:hypothetical protein
LTDVQVRGFESDGVGLISPLAPDFDSRARGLTPTGFSEVVQEAKPYIVIVVNSAPQRIVALTLSSSNAEGQGTPSPLFMFYPKSPEENHLYLAPNAVGAAGVNFGDRSKRGIPPGGQQLFGIGFEIPETRVTFGDEHAADGWNDERMWTWIIETTKEFILRIKRQDPDTKGIRVRLDAVIFEDGLLIGADDRHFLQRALTTQVQARQALYRRLANLIDNGASVEEAFQSAPLPQIEDFIQDTNHMDEGPDPFQDQNARMEAIHTVIALRKIYGDARIREALGQALLKVPFVVHRK